jgi:hypothetical protein
VTGSRLRPTDDGGFPEGNVRCSMYGSDAFSDPGRSLDKCERSTSPWMVCALDTADRTRSAPRRARPPRARSGMPPTDADWTGRCGKDPACDDAPRQCVGRVSRPMSIRATRRCAASYVCARSHRMVTDRAGIGFTVAAGRGRRRPRTWSRAARARQFRAGDRGRVVRGRPPLHPAEHAGRDHQP